MCKNNKKVMEKLMKKNPAEKRLKCISIAYFVKHVPDMIIQK